MAANRIDIEHLAKLAALRLNDEERAAALNDLERIIALVDQMQAVETRDVPPLAHPLDAAARLRPDQVTEADARERCQAGAPAVRDGLYIVPRALG